MSCNHINIFYKEMKSRPLRCSLVRLISSEYPVRCGQKSPSQECTRRILTMGGRLFQSIDKKTG